MPRGGMPRVAVAVTTTPAADAAVRLAAREAALRGYELRLVCGLILDASGKVGSYPAAEEALERAASAAREVAAELTLSTAIHESTLTAAILRESHLADLIVIDDGELTPDTAGSMELPAIQVASQAECTVLIGRAAGRHEGPVLVGVDSSAGGERALEFAFEAAALRQSELIVVRVVADDESDPDGVIAVHLADTVEPWQEKYPGVRVSREVRYGAPAPVLVDLSRDAGLVVVGACGHRPLSAPLAPVAQAVLRHASCPTAIVRRIPPTERAPR
ncbi:MAG TPA: universal stress protein [Micromonospora sp.]